MAKKPSKSRLQKVDLTRPRNDVAQLCEGCGETLTHIHLCDDCIAIVTEVDTDVASAPDPMKIDD